MLGVFYCGLMGDVKTDSLMDINAVVRYDRLVDMNVRIVNH